MRPDVLLIVCDTARIDAFEPWGGTAPTPVISRLAGKGLVYERAVTTSPWTLPAHGSLFTGLVPTEHQIVGDRLTWTEQGPSAPAALTTAYEGPWLPEQMAGLGFRTLGVSCNPWIGRWGGFERGFEDFVDVVPRTASASSAGRARRVAGRVRQVARGGGHGGLRAVEAVRDARRLDDDRPVFGFVNLMEVHSPYDPPRGVHPGPFRPSLRYRQLRQMGRFRTRTDPRYVVDLRSLYFAAAREEDRIVGEVVDAFARRGRPLAVVLVSDHGENLGDHGLWGHHSSLHETLLHVPLLVVGPGVRAGRIEQVVSASILPGVVLALAEGRPLPVVEPSIVVTEYESAVGQFGTDLPPEIRTSGPRLAHVAGVAVRDDDLKLVVLEDGSERVVDLARDPEERGEAAPARPEAIERLREEVVAWRQRRRAAGPAAPRQGDVDEEIAAHLRDLGYLE
jgi:arylsulfatase A-like enzyme